MITAELPLQEMPAVVRTEPAKVHCGDTVYYEFAWVFPPPVVELTDREVLMLAEDSGAFTFLDSPEEDIYNDLLAKKS
jgi:hypothetical protein